MRPYKYRGKRLVQKDWVHLDVSEELISETPGIFLQYEIIPETVGQYIGKQDKVRFDIYEGDICQREDTSVDYIIEWDDNHCGFVANEIGGFDGFVIDSNYKIIGNMYDNPELLNRQS